MIRESRLFAALDMSSRLAMSGDRLRLYCDDQPRIESKCQLVPDTTYAVRLYSTRLTDNRYFDARAVKPSPQFLMVVHWASAHHATPMYALYGVDEISLSASQDSTQLQAGVLDLLASIRTSMASRNRTRTCNPPSTLSVCVSLRDDAVGRGVARHRVARQPHLIPCQHAWSNPQPTFAWTETSFCGRNFPSCCMTKNCT